jgi:hypothetical protein
MRDDNSTLQAFDLAQFGVHAVRARHQLNLSRAELARQTGLTEDKLRRLELCDGGVTLRDASVVQRTLGRLLEALLGVDSTSSNGLRSHRSAPRTGSQRPV